MLNYLTYLKLTVRVSGFSKSMLEVLLPMNWMMLNVKTDGNVCAERIFRTVIL